MEDFIEFMFCWGYVSVPLAIWMILTTIVEKILKVKK